MPRILRPFGSTARKAKAGMSALLPTRYVGGLPFTSWLPIDAERDEVIAAGVLLPGILIDVGPSPRVERHVFAEVWSAPARGPWILDWGGPECGESLPRRGIPAVVEPVAIERGAEHFDLRARGDVFRFADVFKDVGRDHPRQHRDHDDHDEDFDEGEATGPASLVLLLASTIAILS